MEKIDVFVQRVYIWKFCFAHPACPLEGWKRLLAPGLCCGVLASLRNDLVALPSMGGASKLAQGL